MVQAHSRKINNLKLKSDQMHDDPPTNNTDAGFVPSRCKHMVCMLLIIDFSFGFQSMKSMYDIYLPIIGMGFYPDLSTIICKKFIYLLIICMKFYLFSLCVISLYVRSGAIQLIINALAGALGLDSE